MHYKDFSYNDLLKLINKLSGGSKFNGALIEYDYNDPEIKNLICLNNHFFHIIQFPEFKICYLSPNVSDILGYSINELTLRKLYSLIHPEDYPQALLATKKMCELVINNYKNITPLKNVMSMDFRIKRKDGKYIRLLSQNCLFKKDCTDKEFKALSFNTDITHLKDSNKMEFSYTYHDEILNFEFPDKELVDLNIQFTSREREILRLLAAGKNSTEIGDILDISRHTVDTHRRHMLSKSHLCNTAELIAFSMSNHIIMG